VTVNQISRKKRQYLYIKQNAAALNRIAAFFLSTYFPIKSEELTFNKIAPENTFAINKMCLYHVTIYSLFILARCRSPPSNLKFFKFQIGGKDHD